MSFRTIAAALLLALPVADAAAQLPKGYTDIGVVAGLGNIGNAGLAPGARFERIIRDLPDLGGGTLGIGVGVNYYSYSDRLGTVGWDSSILPIGATGNYHFKLANKKWDAFVGAGLGYQIINCSFSGLGTSGDLCGNSAVYFIGRAGGRYFYRPNLALYADAGAGDAALNIGATLKLR
jgi:hypothetical protein